MRKKSRIAGRIFTATMLISMLLVSSIAQAAPPAAVQKAAPQVQAAPSAAQRVLDRNAPPAGTITITSPASGETWYPTDRKEIQWTCTGSCSLVDVTLWLGGVKAFVVGTAIGSGRTSYTVPTGAAAGNYELRVTSDYDTGVEARQAVVIAAVGNVIINVTLNGQPKAGVTVTNDTSYWGGRAYSSAPTDSQGNTTLRNIVPGYYQFLATSGTASGRSDVTIPKGGTATASIIMYEKGQEPQKNSCRAANPDSCAKVPGCLWVGNKCVPFPKL